MKVILNGSAINFEGSKTSLAQAISNSGIEDFKGLAIAVNDTVIPRATWSIFQLNENDTITIIRATQGG